MTTDRATSFCAPKEKNVEQQQPRALVVFVADLRPPKIFVNNSRSTLHTDVRARACVTRKHLYTYYDIFRGDFLFVRIFYIVLIVCVTLDFLHVSNQKKKTNNYSRNTYTIYCIAIAINLIILSKSSCEIQNRIHVLCQKISFSATYPKKKYLKKKYFVSFSFGAIANP